MKVQVNRAEIEAMKKQLNDLTSLTIQQGQILKTLTTLIHGDETLGIEGLNIRQLKEDGFKEHVRENFRQIGHKMADNNQTLFDEIDNKTSEIMTAVNEKLKPLISNVNDLLDWRKSWNKTIEIVTGTKTFRIVIFIVIILICTGIFIKVKLLGWLDK